MNEVETGEQTTKNEELKLKALDFGAFKHFMSHISRRRRMISRSANRNFHFIIQQYQLETIIEGTSKIAGYTEKVLIFQLY